MKRCRFASAHGDVVFRHVDGFIERLHVGFRSVELRFVTVDVLPRHRPLRDQSVVPLVSQARHIAIRFTLLQIGFRLLESGFRLIHRRFRLLYLLVELGRFHLCQKLTVFHAVADVDQACLDITARARQHRSFGYGLDVSRQHQLAFPRRLLDNRNVDRGQRGNVFARFFRQRGLTADLRQVSCEKRAGQDRNRDDRQHPERCRRRPTRLPVPSSRLLCMQLALEFLDLGEQALFCSVVSRRLHDVCLLCSIRSRLSHADK